MTQIWCELRSGMSALHGACVGGVAGFCIAVLTKLFACHRTKRSWFCIIVWFLLPASELFSLLKSPMRVEVLIQTVMARSDRAFTTEIRFEVCVGPVLIWIRSAWRQRHFECRTWWDIYLYTIDEVECLWESCSVKVKMSHRLFLAEKSRVCTASR